ncbi:diguanylate cyclase [Alkaliphilus metalliredigens QYMF]|uniref:Diguanylate cyclase n=1 Tax=Alkaliphilus metalliredigens (strain QYMF) TaxID=293826 RepID=A6TUF0_ALKMQ|nr:diguanylate cyclase [Alkaliphilus metalliredigens]ABR49818.1 diguanylate cyclase [Alkaliphilus metalliredigens QYMF]
MFQIKWDHKKLIAKCNNTIEKVDLLVLLSEKIENESPTYAFELSQKSHVLASQENYEEGIAKALYGMGRSSWIMGNLEEAASYLLDSLALIQTLEMVEYEVKALNVLGNINLYLQIYDQALAYYLKALKIAEYIDSTYMKAKLYNNIGEIYKELHDYETALQYYTQSLEIHEALGPESSKSIPLSNIGCTYWALEKYDLAKSYHEKVLILNQGSHDKMGEAYSLHQLGRVCHSVNKDDQALPFFQKSLSIFRETDDKFHEIDVLIDLHTLLLESQHYNEALAHLNRALKLAEETKTRAVIAKVCSHSVTAYEHIGNDEMTLYYYKKLHDAERQTNHYELEQRLKSIITQIKADETSQENEVYRLMNLELNKRANELEKKQSELYESYHNVKVISEVGQSITSTLDLDKVFHRVYENINSLMDAAVFGIGLYNEEKKIINYKFYMEEGVKGPGFSTSLNNKSSWAAWSLRNRKEVIVNDVEKQYPLYVKKRLQIVGTQMESIIYYPLIVEEKIVGVLTVQSKKKNAYTQYTLDTIKALGSYISIAINNAQNSQKLATEIQMRKEAQQALEAVNNKLMKLSELDGLTGIPNRRTFDEYFDFRWTKAQQEYSPLSLLFIDIDHFKEYNDFYGHIDGDEVIRQVATALEDAVQREGDFVARYGGDEFVAILPNTGSQGALQVAEVIQQNIQNLRIQHKHSQTANYITASIGIASITPNRMLTKEALIKISDEALYKAKEKGRHRIESIAL